jgi:hypothetical protein
VVVVELFSCSSYIEVIDGALGPGDIGEDLDVCANDVVFCGTLMGASEFLEFPFGNLHNIGRRFRIGNLLLKICDNIFFTSATTAIFRAKLLFDRIQLLS